MIVARAVPVDKYGPWVTSVYYKYELLCDDVVGCGYILRSVAYVRLLKRYDLRMFLTMKFPIMRALSIVPTLSLSDALSTMFSIFDTR